MNGRYRLEKGSLIAVLLVAGVVLAGDLTPPGPPGATMKTLQEIYDKQAATHQLVGAFVSPQTLSATTTVVRAGYYQATDLAIVDPDLAAENIKKDVAAFGVTGTHEGVSNPTYTFAVPKTGQTTSFQTGDDGDYQRGVEWPSLRFTIQSDTNCVLDNLTGLIWARNANLDGAKNWPNAIAYCEGLDYGGQTDWRLPNLRELQSLIDYGHIPALPAEHPFASVNYGYFWSSTVRPDDASTTDMAWTADLYWGRVYYRYRSEVLYVWPVRAGQ